MVRKKPKTPAKKTRAKKTSTRVVTPEIIAPENLESIAPENDERDNIDLTKDETALAIKEDGALVGADPVSRYLAEIRKYPLLTRDEEYKLAVRYRETGDREAAQKLVTSNLRFVVKIAMEYSKFGARLIDLIQEGNVGLMQAVKEFNPYKGVRLITYAVWWIRGHIQEFLMRHYSMVRIGTTHNQRKLFYELQRSRDQLERMGMEAGLMQISGRLGISEDEVKEMSGRVLQRDVSLDKPVGDDGRTTVADLTVRESAAPADEIISHQEQLSLLQEQIEKIRPTLNAREVFILENRLLADEPLTLQQIGDKYGITREAARQLEARLIQKIRGEMGARQDDR